MRFNKASVLRLGDKWYTDKYFSFKDYSIGVNEVMQTSFGDHFRWVKREVVPRILEYSCDSHLFKQGIKPYHYFEV